MEITCPRCQRTADIDRAGITAESYRWLCPGCSRNWQVRTVFFEETTGPKGDEWRIMAKRLRAEQGMSQTQLGELVGVSAAYISHLEAGKRHPSATLCRRILEALGAHDEAARI